MVRRTMLCFPDLWRVAVYELRSYVAWCIGVHVCDDISALCCLYSMFFLRVRFHGGACVNHNEFAGMCFTQRRQPYHSAFCSRSSERGACHWRFFYCAFDVLPLMHLICRQCMRSLHRVLFTTTLSTLPFCSSGIERRLALSMYLQSSLSPTLGRYG